jgi:arginase
MASTSITIIFSPYHVGIRDHRVGDGPNRLLQHGVIDELKSLGLNVIFHEIDRVDDFEGEIGRSFEVLRRTSAAVSKAVKSSSFPIVLSGNCMATVGIAAGLDSTDLAFIYFDAHDDMDTPSINTNGYLDAMGLSMLAGKSFHRLTKTVPGLQPVTYDRFLYVGLRDLDEVQRSNVKESGAEVIWGDATAKVEFAGQLNAALDRRSFSPALVHLDLDVLDESLGKVNGFESPGGLTEDDLVDCMGLVPKKARPVSLTVCSFNPKLGDGDKIAKIGVRAIVTFVKGLLGSEILMKTT